MVLLLNAVLVVAGLIVVGAAEENQQDKSWESDIIKGLPNCTTCADSTRLSSTIIFPEDDTKPYPTGCKCIWEVDVEEGYGIDITIENVTLNGQNEDVLYIRGGTQNDVQGKGMIFTWEIKDKKFTIKNSNKLMVMFVSPKKDDKHKYTGFKLRYQRHGEITTTPEPTTTAQPLPTSAPGGARPELVVYLKGITPANFNKNLKNFTEPLAKYAESFCKDKNITTVNPLTDKNVVINAIQYCPRYWPQQENCVDVRFSIPVELKEQVKNANATYQLSKWNLQRLWKGFAKTELQKLNLKEYESPDDAYYLSLWMGVTVGTLAIVLLAFLAIMYWIWRTSITKDYSSVGSKHNSSNLSYRAPGEIDLGLDGHKRPSTLSLYGESHQVVPGLFDDELERRYHEYAPNIPPPTYASRLTDDDTDWSSSARGNVNEAFDAEERKESKARSNIPSKASAEIPDDYLQNMKQPVRISGNNHEESKI